MSVSSEPLASRAGLSAAVQGGQVLACRYEQHRPVERLNGHLPGDGGFVGIGRADQREVGHGAPARELLHGLVCGAVFAHRDAVVCEHQHNMRMHQRSHADGGAHVVGDEEESRSQRQEDAVRCQSVDDGAHGVLAHIEVQLVPGAAPAASVAALRIFTGVTWRVEGDLPLQRRVGRGIQIARAAEERW